MTMAVYPEFMVYGVFSFLVFCGSLVVGPFLWVCGLDYFIELFNFTISQCNLNLEIVNFLRFVPILTDISLFALLYICRFEIMK